MTQEEKELLFKDICARLPYGVMCSIADYEEEYWNIHGDGSIVKSDDKPVRATGVDINSKIIRLSGSVSSVYASDDFNGLKPYLRPMSSMTEEEKTEYFEMHVTGIDSWYIVDWLNKRHLDYHYLIDKGLALEAKEGMYKI